MPELGDNISFEHFPNTRFDNVELTSYPDIKYNCISWAAGLNDRISWPHKKNKAFWPSSIKKEVTLEAFIGYYEFYGYECCENGDLEPGFIKVAIYCKDSKPTHAARQLSSGTWTSKLGLEWDVMHSLPSIEGDFYGYVTQFMRKKT